MKRESHPLWPTEVDPEHIVARGFDIALTDGEITIADEEISLPSSLVLRSVWGRALRSERKNWPYDFTPLFYSGPQLWVDQALSAPRYLTSIMGSSGVGPGRGAFVALEEVPRPYDIMEFVFRPNAWPEPLPDEIFMAWVVFDSLPLELDPFAVAATRVLEPLISELRLAVDQADGRGVTLIDDLRQEIDALALAVRDMQSQPTQMRRSVKALLAAISAILLGILANRLDHVIDRIDWPSVYSAVLEAIRRLALN